MENTQEIVTRILAGEVRAAARLMRDLDDGVPAAREVLKHLYPNSGQAHIVGIKRLMSWIEKHCDESGNLYNLYDARQRLERLEAMAR